MRMPSDFMLLCLAYFDIIAFVIVATLSEQPVLNDLVYIQNIENRIGVLITSGKSAPRSRKAKYTEGKLTLLKLAVKTTTS